MKAAITIEIDTDGLADKTDSYLMALWHVAQANPAEVGEPTAVAIATAITQEIVRRFLSQTSPLMHAHKAGDKEWRALMEAKGVLPPPAAATPAPAQGVAHG